MGGSTSKPEEEPTEEDLIQLCKDRKDFIRQAIKHRARFASSHMAYIQSLRQVSVAITNYIEGQNRLIWASDPHVTSPSLPITTNIAEANAVERSVASEHLLVSNSNPFVSIEENPQLETVTIESNYLAEDFGMGGFFTAQSSPVHAPFLASSYDKSSYQAPSENLDFDLFWNPFSSLDTYGHDYPSQDGERKHSSPIEAAQEQESDEETILVAEQNDHEQHENAKPHLNSIREGDSGNDVAVNKIGRDTAHRERELQPPETEASGIAEKQNAVKIDVTKEQSTVENEDTTEETLTFHVNLSRNVTGVHEAMMEIDNQFTRICNCADEVSEILEASLSHYCPTSYERSAIKMLNPMALLGSGSSRASSSRFSLASTSSRCEESETSSHISEKSSHLSSSHHSTLDRLYAWEKKLYEEVQNEEYMRILYEKKYKELRKQDMLGADFSDIDKTRIAIRELQSTLDVSIHSIRSISRRIEALRDEELYPQLIELIQGLSRMWRTTSDAHRIQKHQIDSTTPLPTPPDPTTTSALESAVHHWRANLADWITSQRGFAQCLSCWTLRCARDGSQGAPGIVGVVERWARVVGEAREERVVGRMEEVGRLVGMKKGREEEGLVEEVWEGFGGIVGDLAEFVGGLMDGYDELLLQLDHND